VSNINSKADRSLFVLVMDVSKSRDQLDAKLSLLEEMSVPPGHELCFVYTSVSFASAIASGASIPVSTLAGMGVECVSTAQLKRCGLIVSLRPRHRLPGGAQAIAKIGLIGSRHEKTEVERDGIVMLCISIPRALLFPLPSSLNAVPLATKSATSSSATTEKDFGLRFAPADCLFALAHVAAAPESKQLQVKQTPTSHSRSSSAAAVAAAAAADIGSAALSSSGDGDLLALGTTGDERSEPISLPCTVVLKAYRVGATSSRESSGKLESKFDDLVVAKPNCVARPAVRISFPASVLAACPTFAAPSAGAEFGSPALAPRSIGAYLEVMSIVRASCRREGTVRTRVDGESFYFLVVVAFLLCPSL